MPVKVISFADALEKSKLGKRHLLLGNGFSISLFPDRFRYGSLLEEADFKTQPHIRKAFDLLGTTDFEVVMNALKNAEICCRCIPKMRLREIDYVRMPSC